MKKYEWIEYKGENWTRYRLFDTSHAKDEKDLLVGAQCELFCSRVKRVDKPSKEWLKTEMAERQAELVDSMKYFQLLLDCIE